MPKRQLSEFPGTALLLATVVHSSAVGAQLTTGAGLGLLVVAHGRQIIAGSQDHWR